MTERRVRSLAKGVSWRCLATLDTILLALIFTGSASAALSIGALELLTKTAWYYFHERAWVLISRAREKRLVAKLFGGKAHGLAVAKAVSWRVIGALDTFLISLIITGHAGISASIGGTEIITKIALYYLHERIWHHIPWGVISQELDDVPHRIQEALGVIRYYVSLGAAAFFAILAVGFVILCAGAVYLLHSLA